MQEPLHPTDEPRTRALIAATVRPQVLLGYLVWGGLLALLLTLSAGS